MLCWLISLSSTDHTIVWCRDKQKPASFFVDFLYLPEPTPFGPMLVIQLGNNVSHDFSQQEGNIASRHYAFLISEEEFDRDFTRIRERGIRYWANPGRERSGEIYKANCGRGLSINDPGGP